MLGHCPGTETGGHHLPSCSPSVARASRHHCHPCVCECVCFFFFFCVFFSCFSFLFSFLLFFSFIGGCHLILPLCFTPASGCHLHTFLLPHARASVSPREELPHTSDAPVFTSGDTLFEASTQGTPLDHQDMEAWGFVFLGPRDCNNQRDSYWQITSPRALFR